MRKCRFYQSLIMGYLLIFLVSGCSQPQPDQPAPTPLVTQIKIPPAETAPLASSGITRRTPAKTSPKTARRAAPASRALAARTAQPRMAPQSFAAADETTSKKKLTLASLIGDRIVAHDNRFLGGFIDDLFDPCSLLNEFSHYRSDFHNHSLFNEFGTYGDDFSELSAYNDTAEHPPRIVGPKNRFRMWISINPNFKPRLDPHVLREWLEAFDRASRQESSPKP